MNLVGQLLGYGFAIAFGLFFFIVLCRWAFRIDTIIDMLEDISKTLKQNNKPEKVLKENN